MLYSQFEIPELGRWGNLFKIELVFIFQKDIWVKHFLRFYNQTTFTKQSIKQMRILKL